MRPLFDRGVLTLVDLPPGVTTDMLLKLATLYVVKSDGREKARTVLSAGKAKLDKLDLDYGRTYAPTARPSTFRILCALAAKHGWTIRGGDIRQAYTQAKWPEHLKKALADLPFGYQKWRDGVRQCVEVGNLYGHPVSGRNLWNDLRQEMLDNGYEQCAHDPCLFKKVVDGDVFFMLVFVDDIVTFSTPAGNLYREWERVFGDRFEWTNFGTELHEFVSVNITQTPERVTLDMERYIDEMAAEMFPGGVHSRASVPADTDLPSVVFSAGITKDDTYADTDIGKRFRRLTMQLLYCAQNCRPDVAAAVGYLTRVQSWPSPDLLHRAERVLIYLVCTKHLKLVYAKHAPADVSMAWAPNVLVEGYSDATFDIAHSTTGYVIGMSGAVVDWAMFKQHSIAITTQHAEILAGSHAACALVGVSGILEFAGFPQSSPVTLYMDNSSAIDLAWDPTHYNKTKHIARRDLFIRELVERKVISPKFVATVKNVADVLTKPVKKDTFLKHRVAMLGIQ